MKQITVLSLLLFLCFSGRSIAQKNVEVAYEHIIHTVLDRSESFYFRLFGSKDLSVYRKFYVEDTKKRSLETNEKGGFTYVAAPVDPTTRDDLYVNIDKGSNSRVLNMRNKTQQINDTPPSLDWHITDESKEIGGYIAIKAEVTFRGRDFEAWFTPEIPISAGPWKLYGLPGLILDAEDVEGKWKWQARNIKYPADFDAEIFVINPKDIDETLSLEKAMKQHLANQAKEDRLRQARINQINNSQSEYKIISSEVKEYPGREGWLEPEYEWE